MLDNFLKNNVFIHNLDSELLLTNMLASWLFISCSITMVYPEVVAYVKCQDLLMWKMLNILGNARKYPQQIY